MRRKTLFSFLPVLIATALFGCGSSTNNESENTSPAGVDAGQIKNCGEADLVDVRSMDGKSIGVFEVQNDSSSLWINFSPSSSAQLQEIAIFVGNAADCPRRENGTIDPSKFPLRITGLAESKSWFQKFELKVLAECIFIASEITVAKDNGTLTGIVRGRNPDSLLAGIQYCSRPCGAKYKDCNLQDQKNLPRTVTQAEWKRDTATLQPQLKAAFPKLFPQGITLGCRLQVHYETAEQTLQAFPMTGKALPLTARLEAPQTPILNNRLAGEILALQLTVEMDLQDLDFATASIPLQNLQVAKGAFEGWTVAEVIAEGNIVLGGCTSNYTAEQMHEVISGINQNFVRGNTMGSNLRCPIN